MDTKERAKWLKWAKLGLCQPRQDENNTGADCASNIEQKLDKFFKLQEEMKANFNMYLKAQKSPANKQRNTSICSTNQRIKWLSL